MTSNPANNATLAIPPTLIRLVFSDGVEPNLAVVTVSVAGKSPVRLKATVADDTVGALVDPELQEPGRWRVGYRVVSVDGHPIEGQVIFRVAPTPAPTPSTLTPGPRETDTDARDDAVTDRSPTRPRDNTQPNPMLSVLVLAGLVSVPVGMFVVAANRKRREDAKANGQGRA